MRHFTHTFLHVYNYTRSIKIQRVHQRKLLHFIERIKGAEYIFHDSRGNAGISRASRPFHIAIAIKYGNCNHKMVRAERRNSSFEPFFGFPSVKIVPDKDK